MRKLNTMDLLKCTTILGKVGRKLDITDKMNDKQVGLSFLASALEHAETDLKELLAGIAEMSVSDFEKMPFDFPLEVLEYMVENEDLTSFLQRAKNLAGKISPKSVTK